MSSSHPWSRFRRIAVALLVVGVLALAAALVNYLVQPRERSVAEAETRAKAAQARLNAVVRSKHSADKFAQELGLTNSAIHQTVQSLGENVVRKFMIESASANIDLDLSHRVAAADHCVQTYDNLDDAQDAYVKLTLGGIDGVVICPPRPPTDERTQPIYEVMAPSAASSNAAVALRETQVMEVTAFVEPLKVMEACRLLKTKQIRTALCPKSSPNRGEKSKRTYVLYAQPDDVERAKAALAGLISTGQP